MRLALLEGEVDQVRHWFEPITQRLLPIRSRFVRRVALAGGVGVTAGYWSRNSCRAGSSFVVV